MGISKRIIGQQGSDRNRSGLHFSVIDDPEVVFQRQGAFSGTSGLHMFKSKVNIEDYNKDLQKWGKSVASKLKRKQPTISKGVKFLRQGGEIYAIGFGLLRHGVFVEKGVGRGYAYNGGSVRKKDGGAVKRQPKPWFNPTLQAEIPKLTRIVTQHTGDAVIVNCKRMLIV